MAAPDDLSGKAYKLFHAPRGASSYFSVATKTKKKNKQNTQNQPNKKLKTSVAWGKWENGQTYGTEEISLEGGRRNTYTSRPVSD